MCHQIYISGGAILNFCITHKKLDVYVVAGCIVIFGVKVTLNGTNQHRSVLQKNEPEAQGDINLQNSLQPCVNPPTFY